MLVGSVSFAVVAGKWYDGNDLGTALQQDLQAALVSSYNDLATDGASLSAIGSVVLTGAAVLVLAGMEAAANAAAEQVGVRGEGGGPRAEGKPSMQD